MNGAYIDFQNEPIRWRGVTAVYSLRELDLLSGITGGREGFVLHTLKAFFGGEIMEPADEALRLDRPIERLDLPLATKKGPVPHRRNEPLDGQTTIAV